MKLRARCTVFLLIASLGTIALAGPASAAPAKTVPANKWATSICTGVSDWVQGFQSGSQTVTSKLSAPGVTIADVTAAVDEFLSTGSEATAQTIAELKKAGAPDAKNGSKISKSLLTAFTSIKGQLTSARSEAAGLDPSAATYGTDIQGVLQHMTTNFSNSLDGFSKRSDKLADSKLKKILKTNKTCKALDA